MMMMVMMISLHYPALHIWWQWKAWWYSLPLHCFQNFLLVQKCPSGLWMLSFTNPGRKRAQDHVTAVHVMNKPQSCIEWLKVWILWLGNASIFLCIYSIAIWGKKKKKELISISVSLFLFWWMPIQRKHPVSKELLLHGPLKLSMTLLYFNYFLPMT